MSKDIVRHGTVLTFGNAVAGVLNYGFIVLAARGLGPQEFGSLGVLLTFFYLAGAVIQGITTLVAQNVVEGQSGKSEIDVTRVVRSSTVTVGAYSLVALVVYAILSPLIDTSLHIGNVPAVLLVAVVCAMRALSGALRGSLIGLQRFSVIAGVMSAEAAFRFSLGLVLAAAGFTLVQTLSAYLLSAVVLVVGPALFLPINWRRFFLRRPRVQEMTVTTRAYLTGAAFCLLAALTQIDMLAAKHYLAPDVAGHYAAACNVIKAPFLLVAGSFATVMFPSVVRTGATSARSLKLLAQTIGSVAVVLVLIVAACYLLPGQIVSVLLGAQYEPLARWLSPFTVTACAPGLLFVVARYSMVSHGSVLVPCLVAGLAAAVTSLALFHTSQYHMIVAMLVGCGLPLAALSLHAVVLTIRSRHARG